LHRVRRGNHNIFIERLWRSLSLPFA
jgi:hypothetical protein